MSSMNKTNQMMPGKSVFFNFKRKDSFFSVRLYVVPKNGEKNDATTDNIFSWVHKEFKTNDINANKHRLLCKLDDMSHGMFD